MNNQSKPKEPLLLAIYNHKGGVGKTTSTHNIGVSLSKLGLRVLLVDADPQYNLTGIIFAEKFDLKEDGKCEIDEFYELAEQKANIQKYLTLGTLFSKLNRMPPVDLSDAKRVELTRVHEYNNLFFLPGFWTIKDVDEIFLGAFPQRIKTRTKEGVENIEQAISAWIDKIYDECQGLSETLRKVHMVSSQFKFKRVLGVYEFNSAGLNAQSSGRPICDLSFNHTHEHNGKVRKFNHEENKKKLKVFDCYLNIIAELFSNMEPADLKKLGSFKLLCQQHSNMLFEHHVSYLPEKLTTPIQQCVREEDNNTCWYSDYDIMSLVNHYIEEQEHTDTFVFYPVTADNQFKREDGSKYLDAALGKCKQELDNGNCTFALAPLLINGNHWVVVTISKIKDDNLYQISVYDPMSNNGSIPSFLSSSFKIFGPNKSIIPTTAGGQDDGHSCGVWVVEYIRSFINLAYVMPAPGTNEIHYRREEHQNVIRGLDDTSNTRSLSIIPALQQKKESNLMDDFVIPKPKKETKKKKSIKRKKESTKEEKEEDPVCSSNDEKESKKKKRKRK